MSGRPPLLQRLKDRKVVQRGFAYVAGARTFQLKRLSVQMLRKAP